MTRCKGKYRVVFRVNIYTSFWCEVDADIGAVQSFTVLKVVLNVIVALRYRSRKNNLYPNLSELRTFAPISSAHPCYARTSSQTSSACYGRSKYSYVNFAGRRGKFPFRKRSMPFSRHLGIFLTANEFFSTKLKKKENL